jgi:hypothetical protein
VVKTIVTLKSVKLMKLFPQPNAPGMALKGTMHQARTAKNKKIEKIQSSHSMIKRKSI